MRIGTAVTRPEEPDKATNVEITPQHALNRRQHVIGLRDYLEDHTNEERQYLEQSLVPEPTRSHRSSLLLVIICFEKRSKELKFLG